MSGGDFRKHSGEETGTGNTLPVPAPDHRVRIILQIVASESPRTVNDLAGRLNLSHSYVQHMFKRQTGARLGQLIVRGRMETAVRLLLQTKMSVKEIAFAVGYEHCSSFIRAFERHFHCPPQRYRQQSRSTTC
ncbi:MAG TPA: helix-turn-helix transcriptional regulator [Terriglobia bacterium]|nr:helix-turn-helix transcriptional regulator [Terriglobia bacterium]